MLTIVKRDDLPFTNSINILIGMKYFIINRTEQLTQLMDLYPGFTTSLYAMPNGYVAKSIPSTLLEGLSEEKRFVNDRPYFSQAKQYPHTLCVSDDRSLKKHL